MSKCEYCSTDQNDTLYCHEYTNSNSKLPLRLKTCNYKLIAAVSKNNGIGKQGNLPWRIKEDLKFFSKITKGSGNNAVVMGRKTWDSLRGKSLLGRDNYILSSKLNIDEHKSGNAIKSFSCIDTMESHICSRNYDDVWIIGGCEIYKTFLHSNKVSMCYITYIDEDFDCDTFFPTLSSVWKQADCKELITGHNYKVEIKMFENIIQSMDSV